MSGKHGYLPTHLFAIYDPPSVAGPSIIMPGDSQYGGATITEARDGAGTLYLGFCGRPLDNSEPFGFQIWDYTHQRRVMYAPFCTGRGSVNDHGTWLAWNNSDFFRGQIPGFIAPVPQQGPAGPAGPQGVKGDKGDKGDPGTGGATDTLFEALRRALKAWLNQ